MDLCTGYLVPLNLLSVCCVNAIANSQRLESLTLRPSDEVGDDSLIGWGKYL
jgi:hypothetical protein